MSKIIPILASVSFILTTLICCQQPKEKVSSRYPNGGSELAWLMRDATDQMEAQRNAILKGQSFQSIFLNADHILTAIPTEEGKTASKDYQQKADQFLKHIAQQKDIPLEGQMNYFNSTVSLCVNCHETQCPGPNVRIKKLYIDKI
ncbi:hypothetical protein [Flammeovirga sp. SJP92]|uniref:hypothetical protein n=1 Tax=Flammeovirga sp. SJP92 TaxID=1775430 RepID=UPI000788898C|nr:hypothetical protein [Flammeovirga sp. SJP92]KXX68350.1 hypothetical protein AVL50_21510 [Flammeovirga sp. SJP92]